MKLREFLDVISANVRFKVTDSATRESLDNYYNSKLLKREIYIVRQEDNGILNVLII